MPEISSDKEKLISILESGSALIIPKYQRSYSWSEENVSEFWEDILNVIFKQNREHFAGALIFCDATENSDSLEVVDGQQRLVTLTILLRAIYDNLQPDTYLAGRIYDLIEHGRYEEKRYFKLTLGETDSEFFSKFIQQQNRPAQDRRGKYKSHKRIVRAYEFFDREIKSLLKGSGKEKEAILDELFTKLQQKLIVVRLKVDSEVDAYTIFETINSKKADLTVSDLLKNFIFLNAHQLGEDKLEEARRNWNLMTEDLGPDAEISQYVRHYWISVYERSRDKDLYRKIKENFRGKASEVLDFSESLAKEAGLYNSIISPQEDVLNRKIYEHLVSINTLRVRQCYPLILSVFAQDLPLRDIQKLLEMIVSVSLRRGITDKNPNEAETFYANAAKQIRVGNVSLGVLMKEFRKYSPTNKEIENYFEENNISKTLAKFILLQLEKSKSTEEKVVVRPTLEHILPQTPENLKDWGMTKSEHKIYVGKLGNLTLVGKKFNSMMSNKVYSKKRKELLESDIKIAKEIAGEYDRWGKKEINKRGGDILKFIFDQWPQGR